MPKQGLTEVVVVMDKSGSMNTIKDDARGAFNSFVDKQKAAEGDANLTLTLFDTTYDIVHKRKAIADVPHLTTSTYVPSGFTALLDAVGRTIDEVGKELDAMPEDERPEGVVIAIITDGQENSSKEYSRETIMEKIAHQTDKYQWEFVFLAAGKEAVAEGQKIGIRAANLVGFAANDSKAYMQSLDELSSNVVSYRKGARGIDWRTRHDPNA